MSLTKPAFKNFYERDGWKLGDRVRCTRSGENYTDYYKVGEEFTLELSSTPGKFSFKGLTGHSAVFIRVNVTKGKGFAKWIRSSQ